MKNTLMIIGLALGLGMQPALADQMKDAKSETGNKAETLHAPTNRVGAEVQTMKSAENKDDASMQQNATGENQAETLHAPTNRVGDQVPTMRSAENQNSQTESKTYNNDKSSAQ